MTKLPTVPQMRARSEAGHRIVLECIRDGRPFVTPGTSISALRGYHTARATLVRWACLDIIQGERDARCRPTYEYRITDRGQALLDALSHRAAA